MASMALLREAIWVNRARTFTLRLLALLAAVLIAPVRTAKHAHAAGFIVNPTEVERDISPGGVCNTRPDPVGTGPIRTLRAAIEEANDTTDPDPTNFT